MRLVVDHIRDAGRRPPPLTSGLRRLPESRNCTSMSPTVTAWTAPAPPVSPRSPPSVA